MDNTDVHVPDWVRDAVFYHIFPDRFANGTTANDDRDAQDWGEDPNPFDRQGGDLQGVIKRFDYLCDLGVNALYFNPIFHARSNHGYDTTDYYTVDPRFGTDRVLKSLVERAHEYGWHIVLDGVFNHTGVDFAPFKDLVKKGKRSRFRDWYFCQEDAIVVDDEHPCYEGWNGNCWLPKLNVDNPETRDYLLQVATYWLREFGIDGWRLDAANEVSPEFWKVFRSAVRQANPDAYIFGEIWEPAQAWLQGDQFDAVTNYPWRGAVLDFFAFEKTRPSEFEAALASAREGVSTEVTGAMFNLLGSHDTERLRTLCQNDPLRQGQAVLFQMIYPGVPAIYYGDEIGMEGGPDPDDRRAMPWDKRQWDTGLRDFYKKAIAARHKHASLRRGDFETVLTDDEHAVYGFQRRYKNERALVLFNRGIEPQTAYVPLENIGDAPLKDWLQLGIEFKPENGNLVVSLPPRGIALLGGKLPK